tara:strand:+ start:93 stop:278 length:186 start_codon:yes stop_codon:yes gene_type:complete
VKYGKSKIIIQRLLMRMMPTKKLALQIMAQKLWKEIEQVARLKNLLHCDVQEGNEKDSLSM